MSRAALTSGGCSLWGDTCLSPRELPERGKPQKGGSDPLLPPGNWRRFTGREGMCVCVCENECGKAVCIGYVKGCVCLAFLGVVCVLLCFLMCAGIVVHMG